MSDLGNKKIFSRNLRNYMDNKNINTMDLSKILNIAYSTVSDWVKGNSYPRIDKIEMLANYFNIEKSDLIEDKTDLSNIPGVIPVKKIIKIPILGHIQCGKPVMSVENYEGYFPADPEIINSDFCLYADGDSMIDVGINEGDLVFFKQTPQVENGTIAAVFVNDTTTLKRFYKKENQIILQPENKSYTPIIINLDESSDIRILGEMVGMYVKGSKWFINDGEMKMKNIKIKDLILYLIGGFFVTAIISGMSENLGAILLLLYLISIPVLIFIYVKNKLSGNDKNKDKKTNLNNLKNILNDLNKNQKVNKNTEQPIYKSDYNYFELVGVYYYTENLEDFLKDHENPYWKKLDKSNLNRVYKYHRLKDQIIKIEREPTNKYDKNAVRAAIQGKTIGYIAHVDKERFLRQARLPYFVRADISGGPCKDLDPFTNKYGPTENYGYHIRFYI